MKLNIFNSQLILLIIFLLSSFQLNAQLNFTVNSLADDEYSYAWDDPDTPEDESIDGICEDELHRCTLGAAYGESFNMDIPVNIDFSVAGTINLNNTVYLLDGSTIDGSGQITLHSPYACMEVSNNTTVYGLKFSGVSFGFGLVVDGNHNHIGGFGNGNEFVANQIGMIISGDSNEVYSNYVGVDTNYTKMPNNFGIMIAGNHNIIGKPSPGYSNKVCGNTTVGIQIADGGFNEIKFNYIGTTPDGLTGYGNNQGIIIAGSDGNTIGGDVGTAGNIISGNTQHGIFITGAPPDSYSANNNVTHNILGLSPLQNAELPNGNGVVFTGGARYGIIQSNVIAGNNQSGILIFGINDTINTTGHIIFDNKIGLNDALAIFPNLTGVSIKGNATSISIGADMSNNYLPNRIVGNQITGIELLPQGGVSPSQVWIRKNIINQNLVTNLVVDPSANFGIQPPTNLSINGITLSGIHSISNAVIDVYEANRFEAPPSAYQWLGSTTTGSNGVFSFDITNPNVEAVAVTATTTSMGSSSFAYFQIVTDVEKDNDEMPTEFALKQNYPNPFNPSTTISFAVPNEELVILKVYNSLGEEVKELINETKPVGNYSVSFDASELTSGIYFYKISAGSFSNSKKMVLLK